MGSGGRVLVLVFAFLVVCARVRSIVALVAPCILQQQQQSSQRIRLFGTLDFGADVHGLVALLSDKRYPFFLEYTQTVFSPQQGQSLVDALLGRRPELHPVLLPSRLVFGPSDLHRHFGERWEEYSPGMVYEETSDLFHRDFFPTDAKTAFIASFVDHPERCVCAPRLIDKSLAHQIEWLRPRAGSW